MNTRYGTWMKIALREAVKAGKKQEVPVGAVLVAENEELLSAAHNQTIARRDPTAHAEILALRKAAQKVDNYRLLNTSLYVTVEPCPMCMGAAIHARVARIVFGTRDPKWGAAGSLYDFAADKRFNHRPHVIEGICEKECKQLIQDFFRVKRR
ncbi:MAG: tRNA adenosine(34) deaminase TadA [Deltaproteobacteria bacterium]|nr:tRNA adenosine(34) deaminase TadA [Deltaproteobacteria bacterium]